MHHLNVNVAWTRRIFAAEKIPKYLIHAKKFSHLVSRFFLRFVFTFTHSQHSFRHKGTKTQRNFKSLFYVNRSTDSASIQFPSSFINSINSSTAFAEGTFRFTTSLPLYNVILLGPEPTYP